ncbi:MAG: hypothetical protein DI565_03820 [Ancylobacter novellus]|uniref:Anti-sigma factor n=1 Tax=Ancylobacter novellus TaxID=921 RepID=A0A2W5MDC4_ANCNO|nr:MAG: hypothetical protein DI565_03820 [Ancylobacter novellus]
MSPRETGRGPEHEVDLIAPWASTGRLDRDDAAALERFLADDPDLARRLDVAAEERDETILLNEALPAPSVAARERLFAAIEAHEAGRRPRAAGVMRWLSERLSSLSPQTLAWGATAAALVIALQAGVLTGTLVGRGGGDAAYETASDGAGSAEALGPTGLVAFLPSATAAEMEKALKDAGAEIVGGPKPGGVFVIRVAGAATPDELAPSLKRLRDASDVVKFAVPGAQ